MRHKQTYTDANMRTKMTVLFSFLFISDFFKMKMGRTRNVQSWFMLEIVRKKREVSRFTVNVVIAA